ncbi:hypothetical protein MTR_3g046370 [Medicago truncatula]|uniref:DNA helicase Pif1-like 2B domain-containing protein n=1 Tax=Medicago truncatula TaxID=3880 RepID=A0A072UWW1_MEDTR|nr:hypothetical protein MTR_3g046370 [Medicago truncatula]
MLMRNIDHANGLCNGARLTVTHLGKSTIAATVITGKRTGTRVFIPKMNRIPSDQGLPFKFKHRALEGQREAKKTMVKDMKEGQPEVNVLRRRIPHRSWRVISTDFVKDNRLRS